MPEERTAGLSVSLQTFYQISNSIIAIIGSVSFSSDGAHIATVADDGLENNNFNKLIIILSLIFNRFVRIWDILDNSEPEAVGTVSQGLCCTYSKSGQVLAVGYALNNLIKTN